MAGEWLCFKKNEWFWFNFSKISVEIPAGSDFIILFSPFSKKFCYNLQKYLIVILLEGRQFTG